MHVNRNEIPVKIDAPGAVARQATEFGDTSGAGTLGGEFFTLGAGTDIAPLLHGLEDDACQAPHWGYVVTGSLVVTYTDGTAEQCVGARPLPLASRAQRARGRGRRGRAVQPAGRARSRDGPHARRDGGRMRLPTAACLRSC